MTPFKDGFGVSTPFEDRDGDILGYHVLGPYERDKYKIVDNALTVALFESEGAALDSETRLSAFNEIVGGYSALYDEVEGEIRIADVSQKDLGAKSLDFMEMLLRLQDIYLLTQERTRNTFIEDVDNRLSSLSIDGLPVKAGQPVSTQLTDVVPDYILTKDGLDKPVALFVVN